MHFLRYSPTGFNYMQTEANVPLEEDYPCERDSKVLNPLRVYPCKLKQYS